MKSKEKKGPPESTPLKAFMLPDVVECGVDEVGR